MALTTVEDYLYDAELDYQGGSVTATPHELWHLTSTGSPVVNSPVTAVIDSVSHKFSIDLVPTDTIEETSYYDVVYTTGTVTWTAKWEVPTSAVKLAIKDVEVA